MEQKKINIEKEDEIKYWTTYWDVSYETLLIAVKKVGDDVEAVSRYLDV